MLRKVKHTEPADARDGPATCVPPISERTSLVRVLAPAVPSAGALSFQLPISEPRWRAFS